MQSLRTDEGHCTLKVPWNKLVSYLKFYIRNKLQCFSTTRNHSCRRRDAYILQSARTRNAKDDVCISRRLIKLCICIVEVGTATHLQLPLRAHPAVSHPAPSPPPRYRKREREKPTQRSIIRGGEGKRSDINKDLVTQYLLLGRMTA